MFTKLLQLLLKFVQVYSLYKMVHHLDMKTIYDQKIHLPLGQHNMMIVVYKE